MIGAMVLVRTSKGEEQFNKSLLVDDYACGVYVPTGVVWHLAADIVLYGDDKKEYIPDLVLLEILFGLLAISYLII